MTEMHKHEPLIPGMVLEWSNEVRNKDIFKNYVALIGQGPFKDFEVTSIPHKSTVYGDERFRDGMKVPEKLVEEDAREDIAMQIGDEQRVKIHVVDSHGHQVSAEFPAHFFTPAK